MNDTPGLTSFFYAVQSFWRKHKLLRRVTLLLSIPAVIFLLLNKIFPLRVNVEYSPTILAADGTLLHAFLTPDEKWRLHVKPHEITPELKAAFLFKEDRFFYYHFGVNPFSVMRAIVKNTLSGKKLSGASTITMQVARLLEPRERTYASKLIEMFRALQLEWKFSKNEILQLYFNLIPFGGNVEGIKAASYIYYQQSPQALSLAQVTTLCIIPNRPNSLRPGRDNFFLRQERNQWLARFGKARLLDSVLVNDAIAEPLQASRHEMPKLIPHLSRRLKQIYFLNTEIQTTIQPAIQKKAEAIAAQYVQRLKHKGIYNCAVLVVNNKNLNVEAYVGSPDYSDAAHSGQVDGIRAIRSPGSTLKPFAYALAFDKGLVTPQKSLIDVPANYQGYTPENFDEKYRGYVTMQDALANSLNVPAVWVVNKLGSTFFVNRLKQAGFHSLQRNENDLGLSVVLGGCGVTLEQLTSLYVAFANGGMSRSLKFISTDTATVAFPVVSASAAYVITDVLTALTRPDLPTAFSSSYRLPKVAWKTGTSYGRRDAWSIGYNKNYTIGVWTGNFSGDGVPELTGADVATPLLFELFNSIDYKSSNEWFAAPAELDWRAVCSASGMVPSEFCLHTVTDYFLPAISSPIPCTHLKEVMVSADESVSYCRNCLVTSGYKKILYPNPEPEIVSFYESENIPFKKIPEHNPACQRIYTLQEPKIISPVNGSEYILEKDGGDELKLACQAENDVQTVYWFVNNVFLQSSPASQPLFFTPLQGKNKIACADDKGRNSEIEILVTKPD